MKETDLYGPVRDFLLSRGYTVRSEVRGCDITAIKGDDLVILEMKTALTVPLLAQAVERQKAADSVYVVVPHPGKRVRTREWRRTCALLKRLELGLVLVTLDGSNPEVEIPFHPAVRTIRKRRDIRRAIIEEAASRSGDFNQGGSTGQKLVTAYREASIKIACFLQVMGASSPKKLRQAGTGEKTASILYKNYYGWFRRVARGQYELTDKAVQEMAAYCDLVERYRVEALSVTGANHGGSATP